MGSKAQIIEYLYKKDGLFSVDIVTIYDFFLLKEKSNQPNMTWGIQHLSRQAHVLVGHAEQFRGTVTQGLAIAMVTSREAEVKCLQTASLLVNQLHLIETALVW